MHDLVIRGGLVVDGSGGDPFEADVAIDQGLISAVGPDLGPGREEIDARGKAVMPGFVDLHTHYDAQATWDSVLAPSSWHGVTTAVMGNCGVGFAPARPDAHSWLIEIMEDVEEIPRDSLEAGLPWNWESFPEYLDALAARKHTIDVAAQIPHVALRGYVMGERAKRDEPATADDLAEMGRLVEASLQAGAVGFACSRTDAHRLKDGTLVPGAFADHDELLAIGEAVGRAGGGQIQYLGMFGDFDKDRAFLTEMARRSGSPVHFLMSDTNWPLRLETIDAAAAEGATLIGHFPPRAAGNVLQWRAGRHPFMDRPTYLAMAGLPWEEQLARLKDPAVRAQILSEDNGEAELRLPEFARTVYRGFERMYEVGEQPNYEPDPERDAIAVRAREAGVDPMAYAYDVMMRSEGTGMIYLALANYRAGDLRVVETLAAHPGTVISLSDGGAHCTRVIDASAPTFMLTHWVRDRVRGNRMSLADAVKYLSRDPAVAYGMDDRGLLQPGYLADVNVVDLDALRLPAPYLEYDLPGDKPRLLQKAEGYAATIKRGEVTFRDGVHTGRYPGQLVRGQQAAMA